MFKMRQRESNNCEFTVRDVYGEMDVMEVNLWGGFLHEECFCRSLLLISDRMAMKQGMPGINSFFACAINEKHRTKPPFLF